MNTITVIGTITKDNIHFRNQTRESFGGSPWFAIEIAKKLKMPISIVTNVGKDFPLNTIPDDILKLSKVDNTNEETTTLDIFADKDNVPAVVRNFTGKIKNIDTLTGEIVIISTLFQEIRPKSIKKLRDKFNTIILDIQGFTRPSFEQDMHLSDKSKVEPENLSDICRVVDILKCSENELDAMFGEQSIKEKLEKLHNWGVKDVIITKGEQGCLLSSNSNVTEFKAKPVKNTNIVGAGDKLLILVGTFLTANNSLQKSIKLAQRRLEKMMEENITDIQIGVVGSMADMGLKKSLKQLASEIGQEIAQNNATLVFGFEGDFDSLSHIAARSAEKAGGKTIAFIWGNETPDLQGLRSLAIVTGQNRGGGREFQLILNCNAIICISGGSGTLMEMTMAYQANIPIIALKKSGGWSKKLANKFIDNRKRLKVMPATSSKEAVRLAIDEVKKKNKT